MKGTKAVDFIPKGTEDWATANKNFEDISDDIDELDTRIELLRKRLSIQTVTYLLEGEGYTTALEAKEHGNLNCKLIHAFMQKADNVKENITVHILKENKDLCDPVTLKGSEKSGKCQSFSPYKFQIVGKMDSIKLYSSSRCKVVVTLVITSLGVKQ